MKYQMMISLALTLTFGALRALSATPEEPPPTATPAPEPTHFSPAVRGVVKMVKSGVGDDVIKTYIENSPAAFNMSADDIIALQQMGFGSPMLTVMLKHDKALRDSAPMPVPPPSQVVQAPATQAPPAAAPASTDYQVYSNLSPYGYWNDAPGYGWYWQPYSWVSYSYYPWTWLGYGYWWNYPGHGWCWSPHSHFRGFNPYYSHGYYHGHGAWASGGWHGGYSGGWHGGYSGTRAYNWTSSRGGFATANAAVRTSAWTPRFTGGVHGHTGTSFQGGMGSSFRPGSAGGFQRGAAFTGGGGFRGGGGSFHGGGGFRGGGGGGFRGGGGRR